MFKIIYKRSVIFVMLKIGNLDLYNTNLNMRMKNKGYQKLFQ